MQGFRWRSAATAVILAAALSAEFGPEAWSQSLGGLGAPPADSALYIKIQLRQAIKASKMKPGDVLEGDLAGSVYGPDRELFRAGSRVRLRVDALERRRRVRNDHWPWVVNLFTPRYERYPVFRTATVAGAGGETALQVSLLSINRLRGLQAQTQDKKTGQTAGHEQRAVEANPPRRASARNTTFPTVVLRGFPVDDRDLDSAESAGALPVSPAQSDPTILPVGTLCKILLLGDVSASKSHAGDSIQARLLEPVRWDSRVILPAGSRFEGRVLKTVPPRWLSRAGSLSLTFTELTLPDGNHFPVSASLTEAELDRGSHTRMDAEGRLRGERPGKAWMAIEFGVSAGIAKEVDDGTQLLIEALVSTATDASTAGASRIVASCISGIFMITRHGRDVVLPRFTEMQISLNRPLPLSRAMESTNPSLIGGRD